MHALNELLKDPKLCEAPEFKTLVESTTNGDEARELLATRKKWSTHDARRFNRLLLQAVFPGLIAQRRRAAGPQLMLAYQSRGDFLGEMGLMLR